MGNVCSSDGAVACDQQQAASQPTTAKKAPASFCTAAGDGQTTADSVSSMGGAAALHAAQKQQQQQQDQQAGKDQAAAPPAATRQRSLRLFGSSSGQQAAEDELQAALQAAHKEVKQGASAPSIQELYEMGAMLGSGHYARVHGAVSRADGRTYAVKVMKKEGSKRELAKQRQRVAQEVAVMRLLADHPNAVQLHRVLQDDKAYYLVMEHCSGGELFDHVYKEGPLREPDAACITRQLASFLAYAHSKRIMHRDIKPENMLLAKPLDGGADGSPGDRWQLKIIDYGGSTFVQPGVDLHETFGTVYYVAPEVLLHRYDLRADVWSVGVVLHLLLVDYLPFDGYTNDETLMLVLAGEPDMTPLHWANISAAAQELVKALLQSKPADRPTAAELLKHPWVLQEAPAVPSPADAAAADGTPCGSS